MLTFMMLTFKHKRGNNMLILGYPPLIRHFRHLCPLTQWVSMLKRCLALRHLRHLRHLFNDVYVQAQKGIYGDVCVVFLRDTLLKIKIKKSFFKTPLPLSPVGVYVEKVSCRIHLRQQKVSKVSKVSNPKTSFKPTSHVAWHAKVSKVSN